MIKEFPMFSSDGSLVQLVDILKSLKGNDMLWSILDFYGTSNGELTNGLSLIELEQKCKAQEKGVILTWNELREFAENLAQTIDGVFVGVIDFCRSNRRRG